MICPRLGGDEIGTRSASAVINLRCHSSHPIVRRVLPKPAQTPQVTADGVSPNGPGWGLAVSCIRVRVELAKAAVAHGKSSPSEPGFPSDLEDYQYSYP